MSRGESFVEAPASSAVRCANVVNDPLDALCAP